MPGARACEACLGRTWLLARLASHLERVRGRLEPLLALGSEELVEAVAGSRRDAIAAELARFDARAASEHAVAAGLETICACDAGYPARLRDLEAPPAVLHVAGGLDRFLGLAGSEPVAIVGSRKASSYGLEVAHALGRGLGAARVCVVSGMAYGVDAAAHAGAIAGHGTTVAVLPGAADRPYPAAKRGLHRAIAEHGAVVSELPPGAKPWRWMFPARNRVIAALSELTVVVEAGRRSGSLVTARIAGALGRTVGAVPGRVTSPLAEGPNALLARDAALVRGPQDALDLLFGAGVRAAPLELRPALEPALRVLLDALAAGADTPAALSGAGLGAGEGLAALASLELAGYIRRGIGGRFRVIP